MPMKLERPVAGRLPGEGGSGRSTPCERMHCVNSSIRAVRLEADEESVADGDVVVVVERGESDGGEAGEPDELAAVVVLVPALATGGDAERPPHADRPMATTTNRTRRPPGCR